MVQNFVKPIKTYLITFFNNVPPPPHVVTLICFFLANLVCMSVLNEE